MVTVDYGNGTITIRDIILKFRSVVTAKEIRPVMEMKEKNSEMETSGDINNLSEAQINEIENKWFATVIPCAIQDETLDSLESKLSLGEIREVCANAYIFLWRFGTTAEAKQYNDILTEMRKKNEKLSKTSASS